MKDNMPAGNEKNADKYERLIRISSAIAIPVVLAVVGYYIQNKLESARISQEYVKIALSIINDKERLDPGLYSWAVDVFVKKSEIKVPPDVERRLRQGKVSLDSAGQLRLLDEARPEVEAKTTEKRKYATPGVWFAVLASYRKNEENTAREAMEKIRTDLENLKLPDTQYKPELYLTTISKNYAITLNGELSKSEALQAANFARNKLGIDDAFIQINRRWYLPANK